MGSVIGFEKTSNTQVEMVVNGRSTTLDWYDLSRLEIIIGMIRKQMEVKHED